MQLYLSNLQYQHELIEGAHVDSIPFRCNPFDSMNELDRPAHLTSAKQIEITGSCEKTKIVFEKNKRIEAVGYEIN